MHNVLILWAPDTSENRRVVDAVMAAFSDVKLSPSVIRAADATAADLTAAEIVVFGAQKPGNADIPSDYNECIRFFRGITLAGRTAGFFSMGSEKAAARLRKALKDTEITQSDEDPLFADHKQGKTPEMIDWARRLAGMHQEIQNARA
jgi:hypothetical protein